MKTASLRATIDAGPSSRLVRDASGYMAATYVSQLLARRTMTDPLPASGITASTPNDSEHADRTMAMQRGDRMLVITGALPSDSLLAMIRRLNAEMRSK